jgi:hypothetical protein
MKVLIAIVAVAAMGCGPKRKNQCASNTANNCLLGEQCSFDQAQGCQVCVCEPLDGDGQNPRGDNDPSQPTPLR